MCCGSIRRWRPTSPATCRPMRSMHWPTTLPASTTISPEAISPEPMLYDIRLHLHYDYDAAAGGSRHHAHVSPQTISGMQRVMASALSSAPQPTDRSDIPDSFGNSGTSAASSSRYEGLDIRRNARVSVSRPAARFDVSPKLADLAGEIASVRSLAPD